MAIEAGRLNIDLLIKQGNLTLSDLNAKKDLQIIDDNMNESTGMISQAVITGNGTSTGIAEFTLANMGVAKGRFIYIESDQEVKVQISTNGLAALQQMYIMPPTSDPTGQVVDTNVRKVGVLVLKTYKVETVKIINQSGNTANVRFLACGYSTDT